MVLLVAHLDEAWTEAKRTSDKEVRRAAKAPRAQVSEAQNLVTKLRTCVKGDGWIWSREWSGGESKRKCRAGGPRSPFLDAEQRELDQRILVADRRRRVESVGQPFLPPEQRHAA